LLTPVPAIEITFGVFVALLRMASFPATLPVFVGAKTTFISAVCPGSIVAPIKPPFIPNPAPVIVTCEIVTLEFPVFFTATASGIARPTISFPKFKLDRDKEMLRVALPPVPLSAIVCVEFATLIAIFPVVLPAVVGPNVTVKLFVCEAASVNGNARPLTLNPVPLTVALEIVKLEPPVFFS
jgi:hypothetical protein